MNSVVMERDAYLWNVLLEEQQNEGDKAQHGHLHHHFFNHLCKAVTAAAPKHALNCIYTVFETETENAEEDEDHC